MPPSRFLTLLTVAIALLGCATAYGREGSLDFVPNRSQWPAEVRYKAELPGGAVFLTRSGFTYSYYSEPDLDRIHELKHHAGMSPGQLSALTVRMHAYSVSLQGGNTSSLSSPRKKLPNYYNYFLGNDPAKWANGLPAFEEVVYGKVYEGIDLRVYSLERSLKYDFIVAAGADASAIRLRFSGVKPELTGEGDLLIRTSVNELREQAPFAYQVAGGRKRPVSCRFVLQGETVSFAFPEGYDRSRELIIDPVLVYATYSGSTSNSFGWSATYDTSGSLYAGSESFGTGWPVTTGAFQTTYGGNTDVGINKYNSNGTSLIYSTYFGGSAGDYPNTMVINGSGELVMAGATRSLDLPVTSGCYDNSFNGGAEDLYVAHFNASGSALLGSTYLGGSGNEGMVSTGLSYDRNRGEVITDSSGNIYIAFATTSANFPTTGSAFQTALNGTMDGIVVKLDASCSSLLYSTYMGGSGNDAIFTMQLSSSGKMVIGGGTNSTDFPGTGGGWLPSPQGRLDGFVAVINPVTSASVYATYIGTSDSDDVVKLQLDASFNIYIAGKSSGGRMPVTPGTFSIAGGRNYVCKLDSTLSTRLLSTTIADDTARLYTSAFLVDVCGSIYYVGYGAVPNMITTPDAFQKTPGGFWMCVLDPTMTSLSYASYFGATGDHIDGGSSRMDPSGTMYHAICTNNTSLPTTSSVYAPAKLASGYDIASWKFNFQLAGMKARFDIGPEDTFCAPATITFNNTGYGALRYVWSFGDGSPTSTLRTPPPHTYTKQGVYRITLHTYNVISCKTVDSDAHTIYVFEPDTVQLTPPDPLILCGKDSTRMPVKPQWNISVTPAAGARFQAKGGTEIIFNPDTTTTYRVMAHNVHPCSDPGADTVTFTVVRDTNFAAPINPITDTLLCAGDTAVYQLAFRPKYFTISPTDHIQFSRDSLTMRFYPPVTTRYRIISTSGNKCTSYRDTFNFSIHRSVIRAAFQLDPRITDNPDAEFRMNNTSKGATTYNWFLNDAYWSAQKSPSFRPADTGTYCFTLAVSDEIGCVDTASDCGRLLETHIYVPSAFSPNGDGVNDRFRPIINNVNIMEFSVYNRYGQRVFVSYDNKHSWDGTFYGKPCDLGVYFYAIRYNILDRDPVLLKGDVTLVR